MRLELLRARIHPGKESRADEWMRMLNDRVQECRDTLAPERMAFEAQFRHVDADGTQWLYHLSLYGEQLLLAPGPVISAMAQWAGSGHASEQE
jgi:hypothetical protein